jgi:hypothetical protein
VPSPMAGAGSALPPWAEGMLPGVLPIDPERSVNSPVSMVCHFFRRFLHRSAQTRRNLRGRVFKPR